MSSSQPAPGRSRSASKGPPVPLQPLVTQLFCLEVGLILLLLPWTLLWDNNYFFSLQPHRSEFWLSNQLRGAVSGLGIVTLWMALAELLRIARRHVARSRALSASSRK